jgi:hypothetical protein
MKWAGHVARKGEEVNVYNSDAGKLPRIKHTTNVYNLWIRKPEWKRPLEKRVYRSEDNVTWYLIKRNNTERRGLNLSGPDRDK